MDRYDFEECVIDPLDDEIEVQHFGERQSRHSAYAALLKLYLGRNEEDENDEGGNGSGEEYILIDDDDDDDDDDDKCNQVSLARSPTQEVEFPEVVELPFHRLDCGSVIRPEDTVELMDRTGRVNKGYNLSGDFLKITAIVEDLKTHEVKLKGHRLRRCSYLRPLFDGKCPLTSLCNSY